MRTFQIKGSNDNWNAEVYKSCKKFPGKHYMSLHKRFDKPIINVLKLNLNSARRLSIGTRWLHSFFY